MEEATGKPSDAAPTAVGGNWDVLRSRLEKKRGELESFLADFDQRRRALFGAAEWKLDRTVHISTPNQCIPRDLTQFGGSLLLGYNVQFGLKTETSLSDVFSFYVGQEDGTFREAGVELLSDQRFQEDFRNLYRYYRQSQFARFLRNRGYLYMVFQVGARTDDIKAFKWKVGTDGLVYEGDRAASEVQHPPTHEFEWIRTRREQHREGLHPHISIEDRVFVETLGGDLTIKVEDNTRTGKGILSEPVEHRDQTLDDAEIHYAILGEIVALRIRPFQEAQARHFLYFCKTRQAIRMDSLAHSCVILPQQQGILLPDGWALQTGEHRRFETVEADFQYDRRTLSGTGEDHLFSFYKAGTGEYTLLSYSVTDQKTQQPISCHGWSLFPSGDLFAFRAQPEPQSSHAIQLWKTPFGPPSTQAGGQDPWLERIGNQDCVRFLAKGRQLAKLLGKDPGFAGLFGELVRDAHNLADAHFWIKEKEAGEIGRILSEIAATAESAIGEYAKVEKSRQAADVARQELETSLAPDLAERPIFSGLADCLDAMRRLRSGRGRILEVMDWPFSDKAACAQVERSIQAAQDRVGVICTELLLADGALEPWRKGSVEVTGALDGLRQSREAAALEEKLDLQARQLEFLLESIGTLKEIDAVQSTAISERIAVILAEQNQVRSALRQRRESLGRQEGAAEFTAQKRLLSQALASALDLAAKPEDCQTSQVRLLARLEELEGRFSDVPEFLDSLADIRDEMVASLDARRLSLLEARGRKCEQLRKSAERVLQGLAQRAANLNDQAEARAFFASEPLVEKVRNLAEQLRGLEDSAGAEELVGKLRSLLEDALRRIRDRSDLVVDGGQGLRLGRHVFAIQKSRPEIVALAGAEGLDIHISGTRYRQRVDDPEVQSLKDVWELESSGESPRAQRGEVLAWRLWESVESGSPTGLSELFGMTDEVLRVRLQDVMEASPLESWQRGVHDEDALQVLRAALASWKEHGPMRFAALARAIALEFWSAIVDDSWRLRIESAFVAAARMQVAFGASSRQSAVRTAALRSCEDAVAAFLKPRGLGEGSSPQEVSEFIAESLEAGCFPCLSMTAQEIHAQFVKRMESAGALAGFREGMEALKGQIGQQHRLALDWLRASSTGSGEAMEEAAAFLCCGEPTNVRWLPAETPKELSLRSGHPLAPEGKSTFRFSDFLSRMRHHQAAVAPRVVAFQKCRRRILDASRRELAIDGFQPKVLSSFVRNRLADEVYLPLIGDNLAKQIGAMGEEKRSDRMGLLLLISPPGYGKTTLVEYLCESLGLMFVKINGPSLGRSTTGIDPAQAKDGAARQELERLSLALEMGDNVLILIDDIQHCHPEFLQKFISLCDGQRRMDGTFRRQMRTWDLRGRRVAVVMAGNPYTESGEAFRVPDMLANRADTFNLGDLAGSHAAAFQDSYLENCLMVQPVLSRIFGRHPKDFASLLRQVAMPGTEVTWEGRHSASDMEEATAVVRHLMRVRDAVISVNRAYIASASCPDEYRTEPAFKLQGSYRNMNKLAEKVSPIMTTQEVDALLLEHYQSESQALARESEVSLLQVRRLLGLSTPADNARWEQIMETWRSKRGNRGAGKQALAEIAGMRIALERLGAALSPK
ncbi:MAG TPA: DNA repair ATPase [Fibrobacteria bacterium]|nr:DNA repair ATPase [Fibrobacteria bacterium]